MLQGKRKTFILSVGKHLHQGQNILETVLVAQMLSKS